MNPDEDQDQTGQGQDQNQQNQSQPGQDQGQQGTNPQFDEPVQPLSQDGDSPASGPADVPEDDVPIDHPLTDTGGRADV